MRVLLDAGIGFVILGFVEAVVKPIAKQFVQRKILTYSPKVLEWVDKKLPQMLTEYNGEQLEQVVRLKLEEITGESWSKAEMNEVFSLLDVRVTADRLGGKDS